MRLKGTNIFGPIVPLSSYDKYPTHYAKYGKGGYISVSSLAELNQIPEERLEEGMLAYVSSDSKFKFYQYENGVWSGTNFGGQILNVTDLDEFVDNNPIGSVGAWNNRLYTIVENDGVKSAEPLPIYEIKETETGKQYTALFSGDDSDFNEESNITLKRQGNNNEISLTNTTIKLGNKTITENETESSVYLPAENGELALKKDVEEVNESLEELEETVEENSEEIQFLSAGDLHSYNKFQSTSDFGRFLRLPSKNSESQNISYGIVLYVTGVLDSTTSIPFSDTIYVTVNSDATKCSVYYSNNNIVKRLVEAGFTGGLWKWGINENKEVEIYSNKNLTFSVKILNRTLKVTNIAWDSVVVDSNLTMTAALPLNESDVNITNETYDITPKVDVINFTSTDTTTDYKIDIENYNTFVINCNDVEKTSVVYEVKKPEENISLKFIFFKPKNYKTFKLRDNTTTSTTYLELSNLNISDGDTIYVIYNKTLNTWSYVIDTKIPNHDSTLTTVLDGNNNPALHVDIPDASHIRKFYYYYIDDNTSKVEISKVDNSIPNIREIKINTPVDSEIIYIRLASVPVDKESTVGEDGQVMKERATTNIYTKLFSEIVGSNLIIDSISGTNNESFPEGHELEVIFDTNCFGGDSELIHKGIEFKMNYTSPYPSIDGGFLGWHHIPRNTSDYLVSGSWYKESHSLLPTNEVRIQDTNYVIPYKESLRITKIRLRSFYDSAKERQYWMLIDANIYPQSTPETIDFTELDDAFDLGLDDDNNPVNVINDVNNAIEEW